MHSWFAARTVLAAPEFVWEKLLQSVRPMSRP
jgi:hypothetical protein